MTTFRQCVVPPPMCSFELQLASPVNQVTFLCQRQRTNQLAALTSDGRISIYCQGGFFQKDCNHQNEYEEFLGISSGSNIILINLFFTNLSRFSRTCRQNSRWVPHDVTSPSPPENLQVTQHPAALVLVGRLNVRSVFLQCSLNDFSVLFLSRCRVMALQEEPLALRQLLWLKDELFVGVSSGLLPTSSTVLMLRPAQDADDTLTVRSAGPI